MAKIPAYSNSDLKEGQIERIDLDGHEPIALYKVDGQIYATEDTCSHGAASLAEGDLDGHEIICPFHDGSFDIRTGQVVLPPCTSPIQTFPVTIENGSILIELPD